MTKLQNALNLLPNNALEAMVDNIFCCPALIESLGFEIQETIPQFQTAIGKADYALRRNLDQANIFLNTQKDPEVIIELKGKNVSLDPESKTYTSTVRQLKLYLLSPQCRSVKWGIITNSLHIQLFRKHGKTVYPVTACMAMDSSNVDDTVAEIRKRIENPRRALTITIYNNKGGVGKTTTVANLAGILALAGKRVLVIDFDPNQQDLSHSLGFKLTKDSFYQCLDAKVKDLRPAIQTFPIPLKTDKKIEIDIVPVDEKLAYQCDAGMQSSLLRPAVLSEAVDSVRDDYDYILIDSPPNWQAFSQNAVYAANVVLIPTKHNNIFSLRNAAVAIKDLIPQVQKTRGDAGPVPLPIFFNGEKMTPSQKQSAQKVLFEIWKEFKPQINLQPYFFPRYTPANKNLEIFEVPAYANIANAAFASVPAVYRNRIARDFYKNLAKEYFLQ